MPPNTAMALPKPTLRTLQALAITRMLVGSSTLLSPYYSGALFGIPISLSPTQALNIPAAAAAASATITANTTVLARLFGVRDFIFGGYLWTSLRNMPAAQQSSLTASAKGEGDALLAASKASPSNTADSTASAVAISQLQSALYIGMIADIVDAMSCLVCVAEGEMSGRMMVLGLGGAVAFACIGGWGIRTVGALKR